MSSDVLYDDRLLLLESLQVSTGTSFKIIVPEGTLGTYNEIGNKFREQEPTGRQNDEVMVFNITNGHLYNLRIGTEQVKLTRHTVKESGPLARMTDFSILMLCKLPLEVLAQYVDHPFTKDRYGFVVKMRMNGEF